MIGLSQRISQNIGTNLTRQRRRRRHKLETVARHTGIAVDRLRQIERGEVEVLRDELHTLCQFLQLDLIRVFCEAPN